jgi:uncharacterized protein (DUF169 family)
MKTLQQILGLSKPPIAVGFFDEAPAGIARWTDGPVPAGCAFWRAAAEGRTFCTVPADHYNCAVGAYVHNIALPPEQGSALNDTITFMVSSGYLQTAEVPLIPSLPKTPEFIAYGPLDGAGAKFRADVVVVAIRPGAAMLLYEAALRCGAGNIATPALGRPGCAVLPMALNTGFSALSFGCKGNRTFTGLPDDEMYLSIPGVKWDAVVETIATIAGANETMEAHYRAKLA